MLYTFKCTHYKNPVSEMTYIVSSGTLNPILYYYTKSNDDGQDSKAEIGLTRRISVTVGAILTWESYRRHCQLGQTS